MKQIFSLLLLTVCCYLPAFAQNSATWEIWREGGNQPFSSHTTDSMTFALTGSVVTLTMEAPEPYDGRPTRRLQITIPNFHGMGTYTPTTGAVTSWENFSQTKQCQCVGHGSNAVVVTQYDSAKKEIAGTFIWKCQSFSTGSGELLEYRVRNGVFSYGGEPKIVLTLDPPDTLRIPALQNDTSITVVLIAKKGTEALADVNLKVKDTLKTPAGFFEDAGITSSTGRKTYTVELRKNAPPGTYNIMFFGEKPQHKNSDTIKLVIVYGNRYYDYTCGGLTVMRFDAGEGKEWKPVEAGSDIIKADGPVTAGGVMVLEGPVRIVTTAGAVHVFADGGRIHIPDIHFGPINIEDLELSNILTGSDFPLPDCNGVIKFAAENGVKKLAKKLPGGVEIKLEELKLFNRADSRGITIQGQIKMGNARMGCDNVIDSSGGFNITEDPSQSLSIGVSVSVEHGFENLSFDAQNISITNAFCLNQFTVNADFINEVYGLAGSMTFPVKGTDMTFGGGIVLKNPPTNPDNKLHLDSMQASIALAGDDCRLIPETPLCFKGVTFSASGLSAPTFNGSAWRASVILRTAEQAVLAEAPWVADLLGDPVIGEFEGTLQYQHPLIFTGSITSRMIRIKKISGSRPWQMEGIHSASIDLNNSIGVSGSYKIGHLGLDDYFLTATGALRMFWQPVIGVSATANGLVRIPAPGADILDINFIGSALRFMQLSGFIPQTLGAGSAAVMLRQEDGFSINASVDVRQNPIDFIRSFGRMSLEFKLNDEVSFTTRSETVGSWVQPVTDPKRGDDVQVEAKATHTIPVDNTIERMFVMVIGAGTSAAPSSTITAPDGTVYSAPSSDSTVLRFATPNGEMVQWTIINPAVGDWKLNLASPKAGDEVEVTVNRKERPFTIAAAQSDRAVTVTWDPAGNAPDDELRFYIDTDNRDFDGVYIGSASAAAGTFGYTIPATLTECAYSIHATRIATGQPMLSGYAPERIHVTGTSGVPTPLEVTAISNQFGRTSVQWRMPVGSAVNGFLIYVTDASGVDSIYASATAGERFVVLDIENHTDKTVSIVPFDDQGVRGCRTDALAITTGIENSNMSTTPGGVSISIVPNPTSGQTLIRYNLTSDHLALLNNISNATYTTSAQAIDVVNLFGERVTTLTAQAPTLGWNQVEWNVQGMPSGTYYVRVPTPTGFAVASVVVIR